MLLSKSYGDFLKKEKKKLEWSVSQQSLGQV